MVKKPSICPAENSRNSNPAKPNGAGNVQQGLLRFNVWLEKWSPAVQHRCASWRDGQVLRFKVLQGCNANHCQQRDKQRGENRAATNTNIRLNQKLIYPAFACGEIAPLFRKESILCPGVRGQFVLPRRRARGIGDADRALWGERNSIRLIPRIISSAYAFGIDSARL